jgi:hypothetical protein
MRTITEYINDYNLNLESFYTNHAGVEEEKYAIQLKINELQTQLMQIEEKKFDIYNDFRTKSDAMGKPDAQELSDHLKDVYQDDKTVDAVINQYYKGTITFAELLKELNLYTKC